MHNALFLLQRAINFVPVRTIEGDEIKNENAMNDLA